MSRTTIATDRAPAAIGPYSQAVKVGTLLFSSGQIPLKPDGTLVDGDIETQTEQVMHNIKAVVEAGGSSLAHIIKSTCFLADIGDYPKMNEVYGRFFEGEPPARSAVEVARLPKDVRLEIEVIALVPEA